MAQHRFAEALESAHRLVEADSNALSSRALLGEVYLELGHYDSARVVFGGLRTRRTLAIAPGLARWAEISGRLDQARSLFADAARMAWKDPNFRREQLAWFALREGELGLKRGKLADAERAFRRGLAVRPSDHRLLAALARLELARGRPRAAIDAAERAIAVVFEPTTLGVLADAYLAAGDTTKSEEYARALETSIAGQPGAFHRAWSLFLLDHDRKLPEVLAKAREELETRRDVYGYDLLAWAWYKNGRIEESRAAINQALSLGTEDSSLLFHAAVIERAAGDDAAARLHLTRAMAINPYFQPSYRRTARAMLDSLEREEPR
jgi:tetratricopeptide (TPR) repeat protein